MLFRSTGTDTELQSVELDADKLGTGQFQNNWKFVPGTNGVFEMTITSKNLLLVFKDSGSDSFGSAKVYVDGTLKKTCDPRINNWVHCNTVLLYNNETSATHTIRIEMVDSSKTFTILGFGYTE